jgi:NAD(P)-dependent dehydrogenase (short-subunit alcohol dehydrogenase family)
MDNKIIFLTGSSSGIGWELLKKLLQEKHFLILPIRNYQQKRTPKRTSKNL